MGDDAGIDPVGLLQETHRLGKTPHVARIERRAQGWPSSHSSRKASRS